MRQTKKSQGFEDAGRARLKKMGFDETKNFQANMNFGAAMDADFRACLPFLMEKSRENLAVICRRLLRQALAVCPDLPEELRQEYFAD